MLWTLYQRLHKLSTETFPLKPQFLSDCGIFCFREKMRALRIFCCTCWQWKHFLTVLTQMRSWRLGVTYSCIRCIQKRICEQHILKPSSSSQTVHVLWGGVMNFEWKGYMNDWNLVRMNDTQITTAQINFRKVFRMWGCIMKEILTLWTPAVTF